MGRVMTARSAKTHLNGLRFDVTGESLTEIDPERSCNPVGLMSRDSFEICAGQARHIQWLPLNVIQIGDVIS